MVSTARDPRRTPSEPPEARTECSGAGAGPTARITTARRRAVENVQTEIRGAWRFRWAAIIGDQGASGDQVRWIDLSTGQEETLLTVGRTGTDYSTDGGRTWAPFSDQGFYALSFAPTGEGWAVGADGRAARLTYAPRPGE